jgi:hypothetical protein
MECSPHAHFLFPLNKTIQPNNADVQVNQAVRMIHTCLGKEASEMPRKHKITFHSQKAVVAKRMEKKEKVIRLSEAIVQSFAP